jgi:AcrR family transcriptional regulator
MIKASQKPMRAWSSIWNAATRSPIAMPSTHHGSLAETAVAAAVARLDADGVLPPLRALAELCGVTHTALYRHFDDLDALGLAVATRSYQDLAGALRDGMAGAGSPVARLRANGLAYVRSGLSHPGRYRFMTSAALAQRTTHGPFVEAASEAFGTLVSCVAALGVREPLPVAHTIFCASHGLIDLTVKGRAIPGRAEPLDAQIDRMLHAMLTYAQAQLPARRRRRGSPASDRTPARRRARSRVA